MLTREQSLDRVEQLREMVREIPASGFSLDSWVTDYDPLTGCGTTCCALGWAAEKRMFGLTNQALAFNQPVPMHSPTMTYGFDAATFVLFGVDVTRDSLYCTDITDWRRTIAHNLYSAMFAIATEMFGPPPPIEIDPQWRRAYDQQYFLDGCDKAIIAINALYDRLQAKDPLICVAGV